MKSLKSRNQFVPPFLRSYSDFFMIFIHPLQFFVLINLCRNSEFLELPIRRITDKAWYDSHILCTQNEW